jgi:hypothetical protein
LSSVIYFIAVNLLTDISQLLIYPVAYFIEIIVDFVLSFQVSAYVNLLRKEELMMRDIL